MSSSDQFPHFDSPAVDGATEDRLTNFNSGQVVNVYDGDGNCVSRSEADGTTLYLVDDRNPPGFAQVADEIAGGAVAATYTLGPQRASQTRWAGAVPATSYYAHDALGSVRLLTRSARLDTTLTPKNCSSPKNPQYPQLGHGFMREVILLLSTSAPARDLTYENAALC